MRCTNTGTTASNTTNSKPKLRAAGALLVCLGMHCNAAALQPFEAVEPHMGSLVRIKLYAPDAALAKAGFEAAFGRIAALDQKLSDYRDDSELNRVCAGAVGHPVKVSEDLFRVLWASQKLAEQTDGAFDITLGPVIRLWRQARRDRVHPSPDALQEARSRCGFRKLHLDRGNRTAMLDQTGMRLDLGGIAKGYAAGEALEALSRLGITSALVAASGDLAFSHAPPGRRGWTIGLDSLDRPDAPFSRVLELSDAAVSTSGDTEQYVEIGGKRYSHIIDSATEEAVDGKLTVSVVARRGMTADSLATAVYLLGAARGIALVKRYPGAAAILVARDGAIIESPAFSRLPQRRKPPSP